MRPVGFHRHAASYFKRLPADRRAQIVSAIESLRVPRPPAELPNVKLMDGEWFGCSRMRVGSAPDREVALRLRGCGSIGGAKCNFAFRH